MKRRRARQSRLSSRASLPRTVILSLAMNCYRPSVLPKLLIAILATLGCATWAQTSSPRIVVLHAARLLDVESGRVLTPGEVLVRGDRIVDAGYSVKRPAGAEVIDLGNRTLLPGLIDAH